MFGDMLNETLTLKKATTGHLHNFRASVQPSRSLIFTDDGQLPVEDGDTIERSRPNCVEFYTVVDAGVAMLYEIRAYNAKIVVGDVGEGRAALDVTQGINARHISFQPLVYLDEASFVG